jgi:hemerythrin superfamily protein
MRSRPTTHHQDAISLLTADHRMVAQLFADYERGLQGPKAKRQVVDQITRELSVHAAIEEAYFYPEVRKALGERRARCSPSSLCALSMLPA